MSEAIVASHLNRVPEAASSTCLAERNGRRLSISAVLLRRGQ